jgi:M6 family metalloprotease-like protein
MKRLLFLLIALICFSYAHAAYLRDVPVTVTQPDGTVLQCFATGDEYFNYLHDKNGFTIIQHPKTGYYVYAEKRNGKLVATDVIAGRQNPASKGLEPYALISPEEWMARRQAWQEPEKPSKSRDYIPNHGTLNNISIFIRFSDDDELTNSFTDIDNMFNDVSDDAVSMRSYFRAASYGSIEIPTTFYPGHNGTTIISYQDTQPRSYFNPYNESTNPNGYQEDERTEREHALLARAVNYINANYPIPSDLDIDYDSDGLVDNVCFIVKGNVGGWNDLLWPHKWALFNEEVYINGKRVWTFNFQLADASGYFNTSTMCHEMNHSLSAPDLYHYSHNGPTAVGIWDLMENNTTPPQHCGAYMKMKYGHWIDDIPEITQAGVYTLNPISSAMPTNIAYKIASDDPNQFYVLEYRDNTSLFETGLPGSGLLIYRIDTRFGGNASYDPSNGIYDEVYIFRPGGSSSNNGNLNTAYFSSNVGRTEFNSSTSAYPFYTDGTIDDNLLIYNITSAGNTISFSYGSSINCDPPTNLQLSADNNTVTLTWDAADNAQSYNVYRNRSFIGNTSGTTFIDSNVPYGVYNYCLRSVDGDGILSNCSESVALTFLPDGSIFVGGENSDNNVYLPSYSYYSYSLTQQIFTADEIDNSGIITSIALFNCGGEKTRSYDFYMKSTTKSAFSSNTDWEIVSATDKVFSGSVTMKANEWNEIVFDTPFPFDGTSNIVLVADDNSEEWSNEPHMSCLVFNAPSQAIRIYSDGTNYNPFDPTSYNGTLMDVKNQLLIFMGTPEPVNITVSVNPNEGGTVSGAGTYDFGETCTLTATPNEDYLFLYWTYEGAIVSRTPTYTFPATRNAEYVAHFETKGIVLGEGTATNQYLPSYSYYNYTLSQQIYTAAEIGTGGIIKRLSFFNGGAEKTRDYDVYLVHTDKTEFESNNDWITVESSDLVFSGTVTMAQGEWTTLTFDTPFAYDGISNLAIVVDDNSGEWTSSPHMACRVYSTEGKQAIRIYSDGTNYDPFNPKSYSGTLHPVKSQIILKIENKVDIVLGEGTETNLYLPSYSYYKYSLSQQIYTASEIGTKGYIAQLSFYNDGNTETRAYEVYMAHTDKIVFDNVNDWITVRADDLVFSGTVTMTQGEWTTFALDMPFAYDGVSNLVLVVDDNSGYYTGSPHMACRVYDGEGNQAIRIYSDNTNYDPYSPASYNGTLHSVKNQIKLSVVFFMGPFTKDIVGYGNNDNPGGYYLIASPVGTVNPEKVGEMLENNHDLYRFNQSPEDEWENWKQTGNHYHFNLESGKGYLYANSENVTLSFTGIPVEGDTYEVTLVKDSDADLSGWNLVGNPFADTAYIDRPFYVMNEGTEIIAASAVSRNYIEPMEGVFVVADADGETLTFSTTALDKGKGSMVALNLSDGLNIVDRAIVRFDDGPQLPKFQLDPSRTKVYVPQEGNDYAIVSVSRDVARYVSTEIPINFKAKENGTYTLTVDIENVAFGYLHLEDNLTGVDVDLLASPSYTFIAKNDDQTSRFKLVFSTISTNTK